MLLSAESITKTYGTRVLLDRVSFYLEPGERVGVIGVNGAGKSTLLRILAGAEEPESGCVTRFPNVRLEYLPQNPEFAPGTTVLEQVLLGLSTDARALAEYEAKTILTRLGITRFEQRVEELSGGQRKRVALAAALARPCDVLILDEPTNHLDSEMVTWLEEWLQRFAGGLVMITHDRYFLERVTNRMAEVDGGKLYFYEGSYEDFLRRKAEREESARASERKRQSILRREYQWVMQGPTARGTKSRERLERYEALKNQSGPTERAGLELSSVASRLGKKTVELRGVCKSFEGRQVLRDFDCMLLRDDRIGIVGVNGSGKSTLLNLIAGRLSPDQGEVIVGETVKIGYFSQENPPMDGETRVIDYVKEIGERIETVDGVITASQLLEQFLFPADVQWSSIDKLSGGEKRRLFLLSILASAPNILLLDEPTNDLDIETLTILEDYLETFPGAVAAVSHDRYFLDKVAQRIFVVEGDGRVTPYAGGYTDYLAALAGRRREEKKAGKPTAKREEPRPSAPKKLKFSYKEQREYETIDADIAALEEQLADNQAQQSACGSDYVALQRLQEEQSQLESALEEKMERWVYLNDLAERIAAQ
ncbi:MAG: ABC-F family ATP-binding cassette domain-containing protein [Clostridiales bacterium]|nr:ABC-F family ATP-binding cassette domain-containing protein [Clostridiales bacterium]